MTLAKSLVPGMMLPLLNQIRDRMKTPEKIWALWKSRKKDGVVDILTYGGE